MDLPVIWSKTKSLPVPGSNKLLCFTPIGSLSSIPDGARSDETVLPVDPLIA